LGDPYFWKIEEGTQLTAALACPEESEGIAWMRLFVYSGSWSAENAFSTLWESARETISYAGGAQVAAIVQHSWFQKVLEGVGFENRQGIVMLEWSYQPWAPYEAEGVRIREMHEEDVPAVTLVDGRSFDPLWHNSQDTLERALSQSLFATVAEDASGIIGYQLATGNGNKAHLARLAVRDIMQGRGVGRMLMCDLFTRLTRSGYLKLSVNTQSNNNVSLNLYQKMGFVRTGESYPVYTFHVSPS
jgi:ribosomal-protein-alanine N-acetyltransferase